MCNTQRRRKHWGGCPTLRRHNIYKKGVLICVFYTKGNRELLHRVKNLGGSKIVILPPLHKAF